LKEENNEKVKKTSVEMLSYSSWGKILLGRCVDPQVSAQKMIPTGYLYNRGDVIISGRQYEV
jgi:hypothetical protein